MLKRVNYYDYQVMKAIHNVTVITASDCEAVIYIQN